MIASENACVTPSDVEHASLRRFRDAIIRSVASSHGVEASLACGPGCRYPRAALHCVRDSKLFSTVSAFRSVHMASNDGQYEVLWPRSPRQVQLKPLARRLDTLEGKTIAQLWDFVFRGDEVYAALEEGLKERYPNIRWVSYKEFGNTHGGEEREVV